MHWSFFLYTKIPVYKKTNMQKLKRLLPSLREKKRYLVFEAISKKRISGDKIAETIHYSLHQYIGEKGAAKAGMIFLNEKYNTKAQRGIIKVSHTSVDDLKAALALIDKIDNDDVVFQTLGVSGILQKTKKFVAG